MYYSEQEMLRQMQECIDRLEKENRYLKELLDRAGISYGQMVTSNQAGEDTFDPNQGARIQHAEITKIRMARVRSSKDSRVRASRRRNA